VKIIKNEKILLSSPVSCW